MSRVLQSCRLFGLVLLVAVLAPAKSHANSLQGLTVADAITILERDDLRIFYSTELVKPWMRVTEPVAAKSPRQQLIAILAIHGLQVKDGPRGSLLVVRGEGTPRKSRRGSILGAVRAADSDALIPNVDIDLSGAGLRRVVAVDGRFSFSDLDPGSYTVRAQHRDYRWQAEQSLVVHDDQPTVVVIEMSAPAIAQLGRVVVGGSQYELLNSPIASQEILSAALLEQLPDVGDDPLRAVKRLPGASFGGLSAASNIRGGETQETLMRFDGLRLMNPFHLRDFQSVFSTIDPRVVRSIDVYTGGFPVNYGDRMSGVIDVTSIAPHQSRYHEVGISFFNTSLLSTGWFAGGAAEWVASVRRSNLDLWLDSIDSATNSKPRYTDAFAKFSFEFENGMKLTSNALLFRDDVSLADSDVEEIASADYEDQYIWLRLDNRVGAIDGATLLAYTNLNSSRAGLAAKPGDAFGRVRDERDFTIVSLQSDWVWGVSPNFLVSFGGEFRDLRGRYRYEDESRYEVLFNVPGSDTAVQRSRDIDVRPRGSQLSAYGNARYRAGRRWTFETGIRWDKQTLEPGHNHRFSPRVGLRYKVSPSVSLRGSWGRFYQSQSIDELPVQDGVTSYWAPQRSDHSLVGIDYQLPANVDLRIELYDKRMRSLRPRFENLLNTFVLLPELRPDRVRIAPDSARARGVEVQVSQTWNALSWWLSYSRASVRDTIAGEETPRSWDQTNTVTAGAVWEGDKWGASLGFSQRTGWPTTSVSADAAASFPTIRANRRNDDRFGNFSSLDVRVERRFELPKSTLRVSFEVDNVLGRDNRCCTEYQFEDGVIELEGRDYFEPIPSLGFLWQF